MLLSNCPRRGAGSGSVWVQRGIGPPEAMVTMSEASAMASTAQSAAYSMAEVSPTELQDLSVAPT